MNVQLIVQRLRNGFKPFTLQLSDGRSFPVPHPEFIAVSRHAVVVMGKESFPVNLGGAAPPARVQAVVVMDKEGFPANTDPLHIVSVDDRPATNRSTTGE